jgi:uncharacterized membrane protein YgcG
MGRYLTLLGLLCALVGCDTLGDPYRRPGTFALDDSNEDNLRAMAANPADLEEGKAAQDSWGNGAVAAITRLRTDTVKALPDSSLVTIGGSAGSGGQGSNGGGTQAGGGAASQ